MTQPSSQICPRFFVKITHSPTHSQIEDPSSPQEPLPKNVTEQGFKIKKIKQLFIITIAFITGYFFRILKTSFFDKMQRS